MRLALLVIALLWCGLAAQAAERLDPVPRTVVMSAFAPELAALEAATTDKQTYAAAGTVFTTGVLEGKPVVLFLSGQSMVNAAMTTQAALDRFAVSRIVFSGIAGGVDPALDVGDVVVADQWAQYLENVLARETAPGQFAPPAAEGPLQPPFGMMFPKTVEVFRKPGTPERKLWFAADPALVAVAASVAEKVELARCVADRCLLKAPRVVVGGNGVSGQSFVDNAAFRTWAHQTFAARVLDMESAAVAQVAYVNAVPFIAFRSLSDLAGGDPGQNQARVFFQLASNNSAAVVRAFLRALP
jgi:adenosylhomocysteine nucleosidase